MGIFGVFKPKVAKIGGIKTLYFDEGEGEVVIFVHGLGGYKENWTFVLERLKGFRTIAIDLPGFGESEKPNLDYSIDFFAEHIFKFMDVLSIDSASIVGNSMGGAIAIIFAARHPQRVKKLILVDSAGLKIRPQASVFKAPSELLRPVPEVMELMIKMLFAKPNPVAEEMLEHAVKAWWGSEDWYDRASAYMKSSKAVFKFNAEGMLEKIICPTLIIWGEKDLLIPAYVADEFHARIKGSRKIIIDAGHVPMLEEPDKFTKALEEFL